jgi:large subunit ribosomal protein L21
MYAVVRTGGKQYQVSPGETIQIEKLDGAPGDTVELDEVLLLSDGANVSVGQPFVQGARVTGEIVEQGRHRKVLVYKFRRRKRYRRKAGHRQPFTALKITGIAGIQGGGEVAPATEEG